MTEVATRTIGTDRAVRTCATDHSGTRCPKTSGRAVSVGSNVDVTVVGDSLADSGPVVCVAESFIVSICGGAVTVCSTVVAHCGHPGLTETADNTVSTHSVDGTVVTDQPMCSKFGVCSVADVCVLSGWQCWSFRRVVVGANGARTIETTGRRR